MTTTKRVLCKDRLRRVPRQFSWVDHRLVRDRYICGLSCESLALYLFLVTVSDARGLSYYSDEAIGRYLSLDAATTARARSELCACGLIAYSRPHYQVLALDSEVQVRYSRDTGGADRSPASLGHILRQAMGGQQ